MTSQPKDDTHIDTHIDAKKYTAQNVYNAFAHRYKISTTATKAIISSISKKITTHSQRALMESLKGLITGDDYIDPSPKRKILTAKKDIANAENELVKYLVGAIGISFVIDIAGDKKCDKNDDKNDGENDLSEDTFTPAETTKTSPLEKVVTRECCVCYEDVKISTSAKGDGLICPKCNVCYCYTCLVRQMIATKDFLTCSTRGCSIPIDEFVMFPYFSKSRIHSFRRYVKDFLLDIELSRLDATRQHVCDNGYTQLGRTELDISGHVRNVNRRRMPRPKSVGVRSCGVEGCPGFLNAAWTCELCKNKRCMACHVQIPLKESPKQKHVCNPDDVATVNAIHAESSACPKCGEYTSRIDGCNHMFCVMCKSSFNYVQGGVGTLLADSMNTNPEYHRYRRELQAASGSEVQEFEEVGVCQAECPIQNAIPSMDIIVETMAMALCKESTIESALHIQRMASNASEINQYLDHMNQLETSRDCELLRELLILAKLGTKINMEGHIVKPSTTNLVITIGGYIKMIGGTVSAVIKPDGTYDAEKITSLLKKRALTIHREKQRNYHHRNVLQTFKVACGDILRNIHSHNEVLRIYHDMNTSADVSSSVITKDELVKAFDVIRGEMELHIASFETLRTYVNGIFHEIALTLGYNTTSIPGIGECMSFSKNISQMPYTEHNVDMVYVRDRSAHYVCKFFDFAYVFERFVYDNKVSMAKRGISQFGDLTKLTRGKTEIFSINLSDNHLKSVAFPKTTSVFECLETLDLTGNPLTHITTNMFEGLPHLDSLTLKNCNILRIDDDAFANNVALTTLTLDQNSIREVELFKFCNGLNLRKLCISNNRIDILNLNHIPYGVLSLEARNCGISRVERLQNRIVKLTSLDLSKNSIGKIGEHFLSCLSSLHKLDLHDCGIVSVHRRAFIGCDKLITINLQDNYLTKIILDPIVQPSFSENGISMPAKKIYIRNNRFPDCNRTFIDLSIMGIHGYILVGSYIY